VDKLVEDYWDILPIRELISDNGRALGTEKVKERTGTAGQKPS